MSRSRRQRFPTCEDIAALSTENIGARLTSSSVPIWMGLARPRHGHVQARTNVGLFFLFQSPADPYRISSGLKGGLP